MKVANFAPELIELFRVAAREETRIPFDERNKATKFRQRCYQLREAMRHESYALLPIAEKVEFKIEHSIEQQAWFVIALPADQQFLGALKSAGISVSESQLPPPEELLQLPEPRAPSEVAEALSDFMQKGKK